MDNPYIIPLSLVTFLPALGALALAFFGGILGLDRFYLGKFGTGVAKLLTLACFGIWWLADLITLISRQTTDVDGLPLRE